MYEKIRPLDKPANLETARERLDLTYQLNVMLTNYSRAMASGDVNLVSRIQETLIDFLYHLMDERDRGDYIAAEPKLVKWESLKNAEDNRVCMTSKRRRELMGLAESKNFDLKMYSFRKKHHVVMSVIERNDLGLKWAGTEEFGGKLAPGSSSVILNEIRRRVYDNKLNHLCLVIGPVGHGKSMMACKMAQCLDPGFNLSRVVFNDKDFIELVNSDLPHGSCIVCDEVGSFYDPTKYNSRVNRIISRQLQTFRSKRLIVFWTVPHSAQTDKDLRRMSNSQVKAIGVNFKKRHGICSFMWMYPQHDRDDVYRRFARKPRERKSALFLNRHHIGHPDDGPEGSPGFEARYIRKKNASLQVMTERDLAELVSLKSDVKDGKVYKYSYTCECGNSGHSNRLKPQCGSCDSKKGVTTTTTTN
jgi:hypothetical protein